MTKTICRWPSLSCDNTGLQKPVTSLGDVMSSLLIISCGNVIASIMMSSCIPYKRAVYAFSRGSSNWSIDMLVSLHSLPSGSQLELKSILSCCVYSFDALCLGRTLSASYCAADLLVNHMRLPAVTLQ